MNDSSSPISPDPYLVPHGKKTGCLPRVSGLGEWCPLAAERIPLIPRDEWPDLMEKVRNSQLCYHVMDQNGVGSCAAEACTGALMLARELEGQERVILNPWYLYHYSSGGEDKGSSIDENLRLARERGIASQAVWPRSKGWRATPTAEANEDAARHTIEEFYDCTSVDELVSGILSGFVAEFGYNPRGGHAVVACDTLSMSTFKFLNSWGNWGDKGFGTLRFADIDWRYGAFLVRTAKATITI